MTEQKNHSQLSLGCYKPFYKCYVTYRDYQITAIKSQLSK